MSDLDSRLKRLKYQGFLPPITESEVAYMIQGNMVIFSATHNVVSGKTSTINAAEEIVGLICEAEGITDWKSYKFYDLQTAIGYPHHQQGYFSIDELVFTLAEHIAVGGWMPHANSYNPGPMGETIKPLIKLLSSG